MDHHGVPRRGQRPRQRRRRRPVRDENGRLQRPPRHRGPVRPVRQQASDEPVPPAERDDPRGGCRRVARRDGHRRPRRPAGLRHVGHYRSSRRPLHAGHLEPRRRLGRFKPLRGRLLQRGGPARRPEGRGDRAGTGGRLAHPDGHDTGRGQARPALAVQVHGGDHGVLPGHRVRRPGQGLPRKASRRWALPLRTRRSG
jgi:hypothetical protein